MIDTKKLLLKIYQFRIVILIIVLLIVFTSFSADFFSLRTLEKTLLLLASDGVVAIGVTLVMLIGELDVSVGGILAVSGIIMVRLLPLGAPLAILITLLVGAGIGSLNGIIINKFKVNSLIATISMGFVLSGLALLLTEKTIYFENPVLTGFGNKALWFLPWSALFYFALTIIIQVLLKKTVFGIKLYAVGGNRLSSTYTGINVSRIGVSIFTLSGLFASLGGVLLSSRLATASPLYGGDTAILVITAVLLGGTSIGGGKGNVVRSLLGIALLSLMTKGFNQLEVPAYYQRMVIGFILIALLYLGKRMSADRT
jgi:ribose/xylose/arabinose/galactoside ABC-type transport system permease subunit